MKSKGSRRLIRRLGLALAVAAFAVPAAQAYPVLNEPGDSVSQPRVYADDLHSVPAVPAHRIYADDLHAPAPTSPVSEPRGYAPINTLVQPQPEPRGYAPINTLVRPVTPSLERSAASSSSGFDWSDAGIGAGIAFVLLGLGAAILAARQTRRGRLAPV